MKGFLLYIGSMVASFGLAITSLNVNTACAFTMHQPKLPEGAEKLLKN